MMMRASSLCLSLVLGTAVLFGSGFGCSMLTNSEDENEDEREVEFLAAEVDSIDAPAQIAPSDTLSVQFYGTVGPNGCYSLDRFDEERSSGRLTVTPVVKHVVEEAIGCTMAIVPLEATYRAAPPFDEGELTIEVPQSDQADVTATVEVNREEE